MSFMAGFGKGFSESYSQAAKARTDQERDAFQLSYNDFTSRRDKREQRESEQQANVRKAKALAETAGNPEAWTNAYQWVYAGLDDATIERNIRNGTFEANTPEVDRPTTPQDAEMQEAGMASAANAPTASGGWEGIRDRLLGPARPKGGASGGKPAVNPQIQRIAEVTGRPVEEVQQIMEGTGPQTQVPAPMKFTPGHNTEKDPITDLRGAQVELGSAEAAYEMNPTPTNARRLEEASRRVKDIKIAEAYLAKNEATGGGGMGIPEGTLVKRRDENGRWNADLIYEQGDGSWTDIDGEVVNMNPQEVQQFRTDRLRNAYEEEAWAKLTADVAPLYRDFDAKALAAQDLVRRVGQMNDLVERTGGDVLAERTGEVTSMLSGMFHDATVAMELLRQSDTYDPGALEDVAAKAQEAYEKTYPTLNAIQQQAADRALFELHVEMGTYEYLATQGITGSRMNETQREDAKRLFKANSRESFLPKAADLVNGTIKSLEQQALTLSQHTEELKTFERRFGWMPIDPLRTIEERLADDPEAQKGYALIQGNISEPFLNTENPAAQPTAPMQVQSIEEAMALPSGTEFIDPNGVKRIRP